MPVTLNEKFIAYLALFSGLFISGIAEYYSIVGFTAIFAAAVIPVIIMGIALGVGKIVATVWLKQNWSIAPWSVRIYLLTAIATLMAVTSLGIFGFLSKAHNDQSLVSGDVLAKISIYDEKIKTERENIDAARKALAQLDAQVDQRLARGDTEQGAERAVQIRRQQQAERTRLQRDITNSQSNIANLQSERAPIAAEVRKVEAEVGPIKYLAAFVYGETDKTILEKAVTWVIILLIIVFDPLAVILLLASQISFQNFRERQLENNSEMREEYDFSEGERGLVYVADVGEKPTAEELAAINAEDPNSEQEPYVVSTATVAEPTPHNLDTHPYLTQGFKYPPGWTFQPPLVAKVEVSEPVVPKEETQNQETDNNEESGIINTVNIDWDAIPSSQEYIMVNGQNMSVKAAKDLYGPKHLVTPVSYIQNEEQQESGQWNKVISEQEYREKAEKNNKKNVPTNNTDNTA